MQVKLNRSWQGKAPGTVITVDEKHTEYILINKIGEEYTEKQLTVKYETKEDKKPRTRRTKKKEDAKDNDTGN
jgi:hypothetical protein